MRRRQLIRFKVEAIYLQSSVVTGAYKLLILLILCLVPLSQDGDAMSSMYRVSICFIGFNCYNSVLWERTHIRQC